MRKLASVVLLALVAVALSPSSPAAASDGPEKRGCCSHHQGVCGCSAGRTTCCDGTVSPTCACRGPG